MISLEFKPDKWKQLRQGLFRNVEPRVELVAITQPVGRFKELCTPESLPGFVARASRESKGGIEKDIVLARKNIQRRPMHGTVLQAVEYVFSVDGGVTKSLEGQWDRHKIGVGWVWRSTRYVPAEENSFVYCTYDYLDGEDNVKKLLAVDEQRAKEAIEEFKEKRELGATKQDARKNMPLFFSTACYFFVNARALRHFFILRLDETAEWEIRRLAKIILDICMEWTPVFFEDIAAGKNVFTEEV